MNYAHEHGVTLIAALGNYATDIGARSRTTPARTSRPERRASGSSPTLPAHAERGGRRCRRNGNDVLSVSALGPSEAKADYSNYGAGDAATGEIDVSAPGGYFRDFFGTAQHRVPENEILGPYPTAVARANHELNGAGKPTSEFVIRDCSAEKTNTQGRSVAAAEFDHGLRVLPADPGHIDGVSACRRSGCP